MATEPVLVVQGGAWAIPDDMVEAHEKGIRAAMAAGWRELQRDHSSIDAVEKAVVVMENDDTFDAGRGSFLNCDGRVQLDAFIMDGTILQAGGVGCVERIRNPIQLARKIMERSPHVYFVSEGAERLAEDYGMTLCSNEDLVVPREVERLRAFQRDGASEFYVNGLHDTVGAVALDRHGNLAAGTSTGGTLSKTPGRVGDSSLIGCGCYADNQTAAVSATGWGEPIMKLVLAKWAADRAGVGASAQQVAQEAVDYLKHRGSGVGGIVLLDAQGRFGIAHNTLRMAWGVTTTAQQACGIRR